VKDRLWRRGQIKGGFSRGGRRGGEGGSQGGEGCKRDYQREKKGNILFQASFCGKKNFGGEGTKTEVRPKSHQNFFWRQKVNQAKKKESRGTKKKKKVVSGISDQTTTSSVQKEVSGWMKEGVEGL